MPGLYSVDSFAGYLSIDLTSGILLMQEGDHMALRDESSGCLLFLS